MSWTAEDERQLGFLRTPAGATGSGRVRYAAAMHFNIRRMLSHESLEVYRVLAKEDAIDPREELARGGLALELDRLLNGHTAR